MEKNKKHTESYVEWKTLNVESARRLQEGVLAPSLMCVCETQVHTGHDRSKIRAIDMDNLCSIVGFGGIDRVKNNNMWCEKIIKKAHG